MTKAEFEALLKVQGYELLMCEVRNAVHKDEKYMHSADVVSTRWWDVVTPGDPAKTPAAAVQKTIAKHFKKHANHR